uniref:Mitochondrial inner membrane protease ATP23 n=1 Tax=Palpitomonas bilix TaxID=652834 RepID=A0A7S3DJI5_9EUKA|mmetsp:Transcript_40753/g.105768  ORF Transcript_40753/g.105768 Transcript_40753/m.105768 type:complete len:207 (+) Transcript_40753:79-699(+)
MAESKPEAEKEKEKPSMFFSSNSEACNKRRSKALMDPYVDFLLQAFEKAGCGALSIECSNCGSMAATGGFIADNERHLDPSKADKPRQIVMCENVPLSQGRFNNTLSHELIHAIDDCRAKMNWSDLRQHACSEIRASNLSGECKFWQEVFRGNFGIKKQHQACVKRRAALSVAMNPSCKDKEMAEMVVEEVFPQCFEDTVPFDRVP